MHRSKSTLGRLAGAGSLAGGLIFAALSLATLPVGAQTAVATSCPVLSVGNPNPGDLLTPGGYIISGTAFDPSATSGSGVARVDFFLGSRESGGTFLGSAVPGSSGTNPTAYSVEVKIPNFSGRGVDFAAYAQSAVGAGETIVTFPVTVGLPPAKSGSATPTPTPSAPTVTTTCPSSTPAAASAAAPPAAPIASVPAVAPLTGAAACPVLSLGNPNPGDWLTPGGYIVSGTAYDPSASEGAGIASVDLFLGLRDAGGSFLGRAIPGSSGADPRAFSTQVKVPNLARGLDFAAYATSAITGQETIIAFAVFVGVPPTRTTSATPTPVPTTTTVTTTCH